MSYSLVGFNKDQSVSPWRRRTRGSSSHLGPCRCTPSWGSQRLIYCRRWSWRRWASPCRTGGACHLPNSGRSWCWALCGLSGSSNSLASYVYVFSRDVRHEPSDQKREPLGGRQSFVPIVSVVPLVSVRQSLLQLPWLALSLSGSLLLG